jgi:peptide/nickel transport system substrate-binding protein
VRRAISAAIDTGDLVATVLSGQGTAGSPGFWHPDALGAQVAMEHTHDPAAAAAALDALGAAPGPDGVRVLDRRPLAFDLIVHAGNPERVRAAERVAGMLGGVGVRATVRAMDARSVEAGVWPGRDVANGRDFDLAIWGWPATTMTEFATLAALVAIDPTVGWLNVTGIRDAELDAAARRLMDTTRVDTRQVAAARLQELYARKVPFVTLYYPTRSYGYRTDAYAGWAYQKGWGLLNKHSFITVPT